MKAHPASVVSPEARIGSDVVIGPFCVVESDVTIGDGCILESHVVIKDKTILGPRNHIHDAAILGGIPQHLQRPETTGSLIIGADNTIRENVTIHRALHDGEATMVGDGNLIMVGAHIAHDCTIGDRTIFANNVMLAGHITVDDRAYLSGAVAVHQFCRIGSLAMVGGHARVLKDIPPYVTLDGGTSSVVGLNLVGLRRAGLLLDDIRQLKAAYRLVYRSGLKWVDVVERLAAEFPAGPAARFHEFFTSETKRGFAHERRTPPAVTLKLRNEEALDREEKRLAG